MPSAKEIEDFIDRWKPSGGSEMGNSQLFATELTDLLDVERPKPAMSDGQNNDYRFERPVTFTHTGRNKNGRIDLYRKGCFILEAKQGSEAQSKDDKSQLSFLTEKDAPKTQKGHGKRGSPKWDDTMLKARSQADEYARAVSKEDGWPPFLLIVDVGHVIELYADFSRQGQGYSQFPDGTRYRITLDDLAQEETRELLRSIWNDPMSLDPALQTARVTREIASHLAELGKSFEAQKHDSEKVARFLMRCLFTMFAEDVELIPTASFTKTLHELRGHPEHAAPTLQALWETMDKGGFSTVLKTDLLRFNGGLFKDAEALPLDNVQLGLLIEAAEADWRLVEPAIFGTLLERALDKRQRHKLGAHYTPRSYVERLVVPTIMEPLRSDWKDVQVAALTLAKQGKQDDAIDTVRAFHHKLCETRVLDPACGSGNFLYVALEMMKRLEGEVTALLEELGDKQKILITIDPHQFMGLELNPWAANVAELVLWIGYLQWHFRTFGKATPSQPVLRDFQNIKQCDAVLTWKKREPQIDEEGNPVTRWDGITTTIHNVTGEEVPDPEARIQVYTYSDPKPMKWPEVEFIVGNPPFIGLRNIRKAYADGYLEALRIAYPDVPENADYVMYWWEKAALSAKKFNTNNDKGTRRFGLITTNSISQSFNRAVTQSHLSHPKSPLSLLFAVPDHPWVDASDGAAVRIAMTVACLGNYVGKVKTVISETYEKGEGAVVSFSNEEGLIYADLKTGPNLLSARELTANVGISSVGYQLTGKGFLLKPAAAKQHIENDVNAAQYIHPWTNGMGIQRKAEEHMAIDVCDLSLSELQACPYLYQHLKDTVYPERRTNARKSVRENWWVYGEARNTYRPAIKNISRTICTTLTSSHRVFVFLPSATIADSTTVMIALSGGEHLAVLSSYIHIIWTLGQGGTLENRPRYNKSRCFDPFPFPELTEEQRKRLSQLGDELDAHRKKQQSIHPKLTLTQMYNVLEKVRAGEKIEGKDKEIYDQGLIGILRDLHDQIDNAVADAYGWPRDLSDEEILFRLVDLNHERVKEEAAGQIRWLRPEYQNPSGAAAQGKTKDMGLEEVQDAQANTPWPKSLPSQIAAVREALGLLGEASPIEVANLFKGAGEKRVTPLLESLVAIGQADITETGKYVM